MIAVLVIAVCQLRAPFWNWDMLPYLAAVQELDGVPIPAAHDSAYSEAERRLPHQVYDQLVDVHNDYRSALRTDRQAFADQLPFYWIKPLYIGTAWTAWKCGATLARATVWPSFLGFLLTGIALYLLLRRELPLGAAALITAVFAALPCVNESAALSTPDALSTGLLLLAVIQLTTDRAVAGLVLLTLSITARADNGIIAALLLIARPWYAPPYRSSALWLIAGGILLAITYVLVDRLGCAHGWCVRPAAAFMPRSLHPGAEVVDLTWNTYVQAFNKGMNTLPYTWVREFVVLLVSAVVLTVMARRREPMSHTWRIMTVFTAAVVIRYVFFPVPDDRALVPWYATITVSLASGVHRTLPHRWVTAL